MVANQQEKREHHVAYFLDHVPAVKTRGFGPNFDHFLPINGQYTHQYAFSDAGYSLWPIEIGRSFVEVQYPLRNYAKKVVRRAGPVLAPLSLECPGLSRRPILPANVFEL